MNWVYGELALVSLAAMLSPTTLSFSALVLVLGERPRRTGAWFYIGAVGATLFVGVAAAFVLGNAAASHTSTPKTWVAIFDLVAGSLAIVYAVRTRNRPLAPQQVDAMVARMTKVASSPAVAIVGAGAALANPGAFIPLALKAISETDPSRSTYIVAWVLFTFVSVLPLGIALIWLTVARESATRALKAARTWLIGHARAVAAVIVFVLGVLLLRNGISGLT